MKKSRLFAALLAATLYAPICALAAEPASKNVPTAVTSERMQYDAGKQRVVFEGNVHVKRPDFEIWSSRLTLHLKKKDGAAEKKGTPGGLDAGEVDRIVAEKNVRMEHEGKRGECQTATYTTSDGLLVMEGNPVLYDKENVVKGEKILFYTRENRSEVHGGGSRPVEAVFTSGPAGKPQNGGKE